ncbi:hypothetical protein Pcinc_000004 [Petrolisthes cinctipes]|uniref:Secreted protein n=1 Tax=Petrolisthes cinctipes TaxID=88211 RepID=A0AAE1GNM7_PETCI|nr:hypothetical protein Pcinc_000004 [Petrolisthes cinctipes]
MSGGAVCVVMVCLLAALHTVQPAPLPSSSSSSSSLLLGLDQPALDDSWPVMLLAIPTDDLDNGHHQVPGQGEEVWAVAEGLPIQPHHHYNTHRHNSGTERHTTRPLLQSTSSLLEQLGHDDNTRTRTRVDEGEEETYNNNNKRELEEYPRRSQLKKRAISMWLTLHPLTSTSRHVPAHQNTQILDSDSSRPLGQRLRWGR